MDFTNLLKIKKDAPYILLNTIYHESKRLDKGKYSKDAISLVLKNLETGEKIIKIIEEPKIEGYVLNDGERIDYNHLIIEDNRVHKHDFTYNDVTKEIAELAGPEHVNYYWECLKSRNRTATKNIHKYKNVFSTDADIQDFYMYKGLDHFGDNYKKAKVSKGYFDIEADGYELHLDVKNSTGDAPVNAATYIDSEHRKVFTLLLRNEDNPLIEEFEKDIPGFIKGLHDEFDKEFGEFEYKIIMFDEELELMTMLFKIMNAFRPDFLMAWNISFDIRYLIHRIKCLGGDPEEIICPPEFKYKKCKFYKDAKNFQIKKKTDHFEVSSYSVYVDQMINYAAIRKSQAEIDSYALDFIGEREVKARKLDYSDFATIKNLPYKNYEFFVKYNIKDVLVQVQIEEKVKDIELLFNRAVSSATRYNKVYKETIFLRNIVAMEFMKQGWILGNNCNINYGIERDENDEEDSDFEGGFVGDPMLNAEQGIELLGRLSRNLYDNVMDYDYASLYPFVTIIFNIFPSTQIGRVLVANGFTGGDFMDALGVREPLLSGSEYFNIPSIVDVILGFDEYLGEKAYRKLELKRGNVKREQKKRRKFLIQRIS